MAYGWPEVIPLESGPCPSSERIIYFKLTDRLLLVVAQGETGVVEERFRLDAKRRREYTGSLESRLREGGQFSFMRIASGIAPREVEGESDGTVERTLKVGDRAVVAAALDLMVGDPENGPIKSIL
ncbi:hypothetical protein HYC85_011032 [Camellia sinensis]|uniref:Uncharacterized protein n=1 Tax=Camellia sinensis TaxID=4442 RepID=A0A7J7HM75_CAMSI|nr:hypothetical protein HYC85_011032 [Camellia sinensis]